MTEELKTEIDMYVGDTCVYYRSTHEDMLPNQFEKYLRKACIHFATENGIQWHDLRKDPNDLPKENELYLVFGYTNKREKFYELDVFDPKEGEFLGCGEYVYAWCEIPHFKE